jgi:hypothetical protein
MRENEQESFVTGHGFSRADQGNKIRRASAPDGQFSKGAAARQNDDEEDH